MLAPHRKPFATRDGYLCLLIYNDKQWQNFFRLIGREDMYRDDPRFSSHENRAHHIAEVNEFVAEQIRTRTTAEWLKDLTAADIPVTTMNSIDDLMADPHLAATGFIELAEHPSEGALRTTAVPTKWSGSAPEFQRHAPRLGENSIEVLREAGYSEPEIKTMIADGITRMPED